MDDIEDFVPLSSRLKKIQSGEYKDFAPLEAVAPHIPAQQTPTMKKLGNAENRHARLKLPELPIRVPEVDKTNGNRNCSIRESAPANTNVELQSASGAKVSS